MAKSKKKEVFKKIRLDMIDRPKELVRLDIDTDELNELANSIAERGLMQPIEVTPRGNRYKIVFGDRRYLAHQKLMKEDIMCRVEEIEDDQVIIDRAMENVQRVNLTPFEEGHVYAGLMEKVGLSIEDISRRVGKSPGVVQRRMDILRMPDSFQRALHKKEINLTVAEELWSCPDAAKREYYVDLAIKHGITQTVARKWVEDFKKEARNTPSGTEEGSPAPMEFKDLPIYRACDLCRNPVEFKDLKDLRICPGCYKLIINPGKIKGP